MRQWSPRVWQATDRGDHAEVLRLARTERGWTQDELGRRLLRDVAILRRLADILGLPPKAFGLTDHTDTATRTSRRALPVGHKVDQVMIPWAQEGDDQVRRRAFCSSLPSPASLDRTPTMPLLPMVSIPRSPWPIGSAPCYSDLLLRLTQLLSLCCDGR